MPNALVKDIHKQTGASTKSIEHMYKKVESAAKKSGAKNPYAVATAVVEKHYKYHPKS